jgi:hypothetical protein
MRKLKIFIVLAGMFAVSNSADGQENKYNLDSIINLPQKTLNKLATSTSSFEEKLVILTNRSLKKFESRERKIRRKLERVDSSSKTEMFSLSNNFYSEATQTINGEKLVTVNRVGEYLPFVDSLKTNLMFLKSIEYNLPGADNLSKILSSVNNIQNKLKYVAVFQKSLMQRRDILRRYLEKYGLKKYLKGLNKEIYYYSQKVKEFKSILNDPKKLELTAFRTLQKIPSFKAFFEKNSYIATVFGFANYNTYAGVSATSIPDFPGLQTVSQVERYASTAFNNTGGGVNSDPLQQGLGKLKNELDQLKSKSSSWDENAEMPDFKPNEMKSKSFLKRIELGTNLQFGRPNSLIPSTADIAGQIAYKFHQNGSLGIGASYKLGYGNLRRLSISHQGVGIRSFLDYKLKGQFYINGGFEFNYHSSFRTINELRDFNAWQSSALIGLSKKYRVSKKVKGSVIVLYDFLYYQHSPRTQPIVFRLGYNF